MMIRVNKLLTAYVEKTGQKVTGFLEFHSVCDSECIERYSSLDMQNNRRCKGNY